MVKWGIPDMRFVQNFTPLNFQAKTFTPSISPNFTKKMSENGEIYTAGKKITLPLAVTGGTNLTSDYIFDIHGVPKIGLVEKNPNQT